MLSDIEIAQATQPEHIRAIAEKAVREMDGKELESLVLSAMKTELKAVVNLGALIGFLLGLFNLAIYFV